MKNFKNNNWGRELSDITEGSEKLEVDQLKLNQEMDELQSSKQLVESNILSLTKKLRTTDKSIEDIDNLKDNKNNLSNTLSNIDNELGEVVMRLEKALLLDTELNTKIQNHKDEKTEEKFVELESLELEFILLCA